MLTVCAGHAYNTHDRCVASGYDNGDIKLFDLRAMSLRWETNIKNGVSHVMSELTQCCWSYNAWTGSMWAEHVSGAGAGNGAEQARKPDERERSGSGTWKNTVEHEQEGRGVGAERWVRVTERGVSSEWKFRPLPLCSHALKLPLCSHDLKLPLRSHALKSVRHAMMLAL